MRVVSGSWGCCVDVFAPWRSTRKADEVGRKVG